MTINTQSVVVIILIHNVSTNSQFCCKLQFFPFIDCESKNTFRFSHFLRSVHNSLFSILCTLSNEGTEGADVSVHV